MMTTCPYIVWKSFYSVDHPALDAQHMEIIDIINELFAVMQKGQDRAALKSLLNRLVHYTNGHFEHEEQIMQEHGYPGFAEHKALHDKMRQRTADLRANIDPVTGSDLLAFLKEWWVGHIQGQDKKYTPYLQVPTHS